MTNDTSKHSDKYQMWYYYCIHKSFVDGDFADYQSQTHSLRCTVIFSKHPSCNCHLFVYLRVVMEELSVI